MTNLMNASAIAEYYVQNMAVYPYSNVISHSYYDPDELYHHGIVGQKWGVRRYQNMDGSLTKAGKRRYQEKLASEIKSSKLLGVRDDNRLRRNIDHLIRGKDKKRLEKSRDELKNLENDAVAAHKEANRLASKLNVKQLMKEHEAVFPEAYETPRLRGKMEEYWSIDGAYDTIMASRPDLKASVEKYQKAADEAFKSCERVAKRVGGRAGESKTSSSGNVRVNDEILWAIQDMYGLQNKLYHSSDNDSDELYHHGIVGQKWGVRRFQTLSGKLTAAGKKRKQRRQLKEARKAKAARAKANAKAVAKKEKDALDAKRKADSLNGKYLKAKTMTDDELNRAISRMALETRYRDALKNYTLTPEEAQRVENRARRKEAFKDKLYDKGTTIATNAAGELVASLIATSVNAATGNNTISKGDLLKAVNGGNNGGGNKKKKKNK